MTFEQQVQIFFKDPQNLNKEDTIFSTLFLLRRDIYTCFGFDPNDFSTIEYQALFPGAMAIMAGIDLLAKFCYTDNEITGNKSGERFKKYIRKYIDENFHEELYQLRNSLLHSFGLYSKDRSGKEYFFTLARGLNNLLDKGDDSNFIIDIEILRQKFEISVSSYLEDLKGEPFKSHFQAMFPIYGLIGMKRR